MRRTLPFLLGLVGLSSAFVAFAGAQTTAKPAPSCAGVAATDSDKDAVSRPPGPEVAAFGPASDNLEITRLWFDRTGGKTTANIEVKKLSKANTTNATNLTWYVVWTGSDDSATAGQPFVSATSDGNAVSFSYGTLLSGYTTEGDTSGKFFDGDKGVIQIVIPPDHGGKVGDKITDPSTTSSENYDFQGFGLVAHDDYAPDEGGGRNWTVVDCVGGGPTGPTGPTGPAGSGGGSTTVEANALNVKASKAAGSAKKAGKSKKAAVKLTGQATKITATLYKGSFKKPKVYGKGKLAKLAGKATLKLKLAKKVKKGSYALTLIGTNPDGRRAEKTFKVKFKK
jgi:hypothetical protein